MQITLDFPTERLLQVKGTTAPAGNVIKSDVVTSLTFITTKNTYGPYGAEVGRQFHSSPNGQVVGFLGRSSGKFIEAFGTFTDFYHCDTDLLPDGPWGGCGGQAFYDSRAEKIKHIEVKYDKKAIISLNVAYDRGSQGDVTIKHGGGGSVRGTIEPSKIAEIPFGDDKYLAQVTGTSGHLAHCCVTLVTSLTFITNKGKVYGPYGHVSGDPFESIPDKQIVSFYGRSGWFIDQLGVFVGEKPCFAEWGNESFGGQGGEAFYEGRGEISQIWVTIWKDQLVATLKVAYRQGGSEFVGPVNGNEKKPFKEYDIPFGPDEYLVQVTGTYGPIPPEIENPAILSIAFITLNTKTGEKTTYGPYGGKDSGTPSASPELNSTGRILGLFGRSRLWIHQIGVIFSQDVEST